MLDERKIPLLSVSLVIISIVPAMQTFRNCMNCLPIRPITAIEPVWLEPVVV